MKAALVEAGWRRWAGTTDGGGSEWKEEGAKRPRRRQIVCHMILLIPGMAFEADHLVLIEQIYLQPLFA
jgi:hypothetical protein